MFNSCKKFLIALTITALPFSFSHSSALTIDEFNGALVTSNTGIVNFDTTVFNFNIISGLSQSQVEEIKATVIGSLSDVQVAELMAMIDATSMSLDTYKFSSSSHDLDAIASLTTKVVNHAAFKEINVNDHYLLTVHLGTAIGLRTLYYEELLQLGYLDETQYQELMDPLREMFSTALVETNIFVDSQVHIRSKGSNNCTMRSMCRNYTVRDEIKGTSRTFYYADTGFMGYRFAQAYRDRLRDSYDLEFKGSNHNEVMNALNIKSGMTL